MKTYITLFTILFTLVATSFTANAQYQYIVDDKCVEVKFNKVPEEFVTEYKSIQNDIKIGRILCASGICFDAIGTYVFCTRPYKNDDKANTFIGTSSIVIGTLLEIYGTIVWYTGEMKIKDLKLNYAIKNGGLILTF